MSDEKKQAEKLGMDGLEYAPWACQRVEEFAQVRREQMKREIAYFCPQCQGNEMELGELQDAAGSVSARCSLCKWEGRSTQIVGAVSPSNAQFWNAERVGSVMLMAMAKHGAGPLIQVLEHLGVLPRIPQHPGEGTVTPAQRAEFESALECRNRVMQAVLGAAVTAAFETAAEVVPAHYAQFNKEQGEAVERVFHFSETEQPAEGGNVH